MILEHMDHIIERLYEKNGHYISMATKPYY
jgi:hypothetical protein